MNSCQDRKRGCSAHEPMYLYRRFSGTCILTTTITTQILYFTLSCTDPDVSAVWNLDFAPSRLEPARSTLLDPESGPTKAGLPRTRRARSQTDASIFCARRPQYEGWDHQYWFYDANATSSRLICCWADCEPCTIRWKAFYAMKMLASTLRVWVGDSPCGRSLPCSSDFPTSTVDSPYLTAASCSPSPFGSYWRCCTAFDNKLKVLPPVR